MRVALTAETTEEWMVETSAAWMAAHWGYSWVESTVVCWED